MDFIEAHHESRSAKGHEYVLTVFDLGTRFLIGCPAYTKSTFHVQGLLKRFRGWNRIRCMYADRALELDCAATGMGIPCDRSRAGRSQTNGIIERRNQEINRGTKALLLNAGLPPPFWWLAVPCYCFLENVRCEGGTSAYYRRTGEHFSGQSIPFGSRVAFRPLKTSAVYKHKSKFGSDAYPGVFLGYETNFGEKWNKN